MLSKQKYLNSVNKRIGLLILLSLCLLIIITRIPFASKYLYEWDSVNYALGFEKYDISQHSPHPPGYIFFIILGKGINIFFNDANTTMIFISIFFSILTVLLIYFLAKQMFSETVAISSALLLIFNPIFWFYGEIANSYTAEAFCAVLIAYLSYQVFKGKEKFLYLSAVTLGLAGGFRQNIIVFMFPLWLFCSFYHSHNRSLVKIIKVFAILTTSVLVWWVPTLLLTGGYEKYSFLLHELTFRMFKQTSIFFGASISEHIDSIIRFFSWTRIGLLNRLGIIIIVLFFLYRLKTKNLFELLIHIKSIFFILWITPAFLFYLFIHIPKPGYILTYLPALTIILGYMIVSLNLNTRFKTISPNIFVASILLLSIVYNTTQFLYPFESVKEDLNGDKSLFYKITTLSQRVLFGETMVNINMIKDEDRRTERSLYTISNIPLLDLRNTLIINQACKNEIIPIIPRKIMYYLSDYSFYSLEFPKDEDLTTESNVSAFFSKNHIYIVSEGKILEIPINASIEKIIWVVDDNSAFLKELKSKIEIKAIDLPNEKDANLPTTLSIYYSDIKNKSIDFRVNQFIFRTKDGVVW